MGNLGMYQNIVIAAKEAGGVEKLIETIAEGAVSEASPRIFGKGALVGVVGTAVAGGAAFVAKRYLDNKKAREALAEEAKAELISVVEESPDSASAHREGVEGNLHDQDSPPVAED